MTSRIDRRVRRWSQALAAVALCVVPGCGIVDSEEDEWRSAYDDARSQWETAAVADYRYVVRQLCFCGFGGQAIGVEVRNGQVVSGTMLDSGEPVDPAQWQYAVPSVDALFQRIGDILDGDPHEFTATYDPELGYPMVVSADPIENAIDEEWGVETSGLEVIQ